MTVAECEALLALLDDLYRWVEHETPASLDVALVAATAELTTRVALRIAAELAA
jgi:hypothetical protein